MHVSLISAFGRQRQADLEIQGKPGIQSEFQASQGTVSKTNKHPQQKNLPAMLSLIYSTAQDSFAFKYMVYL